MFKIDIILPYKELFSSNGASAVSISVKNSILKSKFKKNINVYGQFVKEPFKNINFNGFYANKIIHFSRRHICISFLRHDSRLSIKSVY